MMHSIKVKLNDDMPTVAINEVRKKRPGSLATKEPENAVKGGKTTRPLYPENLGMGSHFNDAWTDDLEDIFATTIGVFWPSASPIIGGICPITSPCCPGGFLQVM